MKKERLETTRKRLIYMREDLLSEIRRKNAEAATLLDEGVPDVADQGLTDNLREFLHLLSDGKRQELIGIDEALERIEEGNYGLCQKCDGPIGGERLALRPHTRYCVACKEELEKEEDIKAGPQGGKL